MQRKELTDEVIAALAAKRQRYVVYDSEVRSLAVRVSPRGRKTFIVVKRFNGNKHPSRRKLGIVGKLTVVQGRRRRAGCRRPAQVERTAQAGRGVGTVRG